jgi:NAD(P)-dependent dehydrogenase (short-subunit alcohol dehydrogenase family)
VPPEQHAFLESVLPAPRLGRPEDIAGMVAYLASDEAEWITGQQFCVDGGQLCYLPHLSPFGAQHVGPT